MTLAPRPYREPVLDLMPDPIPDACNVAVVPKGGMWNGPRRPCLLAPKEVGECGRMLCTRHLADERHRLDWLDARGRCQAEAMDLVKRLALGPGIAADWCASSGPGANFDYDPEGSVVLVLDLAAARKLVALLDRAGQP